MNKLCSYIESNKKRNASVLEEEKMKSLEYIPIEIINNFKKIEEVDRKVDELITEDNIVENCEKNDILSYIPYEIIKYVKYIKRLEELDYYINNLPEEQIHLLKNLYAEKDDVIRCIPYEIIDYLECIKHIKNLDIEIKKGNNVKNLYKQRDELLDLVQCNIINYIIN